MEKFKIKIEIDVNANFEDWMNNNSMNKGIIEQLILSRLHERSFIRNTYYVKDEQSYDEETVQLHTFVNEIDFA